MEEIIKKLKPEKKINFKLDSLNLENWYNRETIKTSIFAILTVICFVNDYIFDGFFSFIMFIIFLVYDRKRYAKAKKKIFEEYFNVKPKK